MQLVAMRKRALEVAAQRQGASTGTVGARCKMLQSTMAAPTADVSTVSHTPSHMVWSA